MNVSRDMTRQPVAGYLLELFESHGNPARQGASSDGGTESGVFEAGKCLRRGRETSRDACVDGAGCGSCEPCASGGLVEEHKFLGYRLLRGGKLGIFPQSLKRAKDRIREITRRNRGHVKVREMMTELNSFLAG